MTTPPLVPSWLRRLALALPLVLVLSAMVVPVTATPAAASDSRTVGLWGQRSCNGKPCPEGELHLTRSRVGHQVFRVTARFSSRSNVCNWHLDLRFTDLDGRVTNSLQGREQANCSKARSVGWANGKHFEKPAQTTYVAPKGQLCALLYRNRTEFVVKTCQAIAPQTQEVRFRSQKTQGSSGSRTKWCLDADLATIGRDGTRVQQWKCNGDDQQKWTFFDDGTLRNRYSGQCLDADTNTAGRNGTVVQLWQCNGSPQQQWRVFQDGGSSTFVYIRNEATRRVIDADTGTFGRNGTRVQLWDRGGNAYQQSFYS